jgi:hypothetical protein
MSAVYAAIVPSPSIRLCTRCKVGKSPHQFHKVGNGYHRWCKECRAKSRGRVPAGSSAWPNAVAMPELPDIPRDDGCGVCKRKLRFDTDRDSALTQECACGTFLVPTKGREKTIRYDQASRHAIELARQVASSQRPALPSHSHPSQHTHRQHVDYRTRPHDWD